MNSDLVGKVNSFIEAHRLFEVGELVVVAVSGGGDSVGLLHILHQLAKGELKLELHVAHLNHMIRGREADGDEDFVRHMAHRLGLACTCRRRDVPGMAKSERTTLEEIARNVRYEFLGQVAGDIGAQKIATGHTADDQVETLLQRLIRGTGIRGLAGIPVKRKLHRQSKVEVVRSLLGCWREEMRSYLSRVGQGWREDSSNQNTAIFRNRLRREVLPMLRKYLGSEIDRKLLELSNSAAEAENFLSQQARRLLQEEDINWADNYAELCAGRLVSQPELIQRYIVREIVEGLSGRQVREKQIASLLKLARQKSPGRLAQLRGDIEVTKEYDKLIFHPPDLWKSSAQEWETELVVPGLTPVPERGFTFESATLEREGFDLDNWKARKSHLEEIVDADKLKGKLKLRGRRNGDRFRPLGAPGAKKLKEFFIDARVPVRRRQNVPLVTDDEKIVWVTGYRLSALAALDDGSRRLLQLSYKPLHASAGTI